MGLCINHCITFTMSHGLAQPRHHKSSRLLHDGGCLQTFLSRRPLNMCCSLGGMPHVPFTAFDWWPSLCTAIAHITCLDCLPPAFAGLPRPGRPCTHTRPRPQASPGPSTLHPSRPAPASSKQWQRLGRQSLVQRQPKGPLGPQWQRRRRFRPCTAGTAAGAAAGTAGAG